MYQKACEMIDDPSPNSKSDEFRNAIARLSATKRWLIIKMFLSLCVFIGALVLWWRLGSKFSAEVTVAEFVATFASVAVFVKAVAELTKRYQESLGKKLDQRRDFKADKGFMGEIEEDIECLLSFLRARNARLVIVIDDLDRCKENDIVEILQAVIVLLNDSPITCFLAIDSRVVVNVLDAHMKEICPEGNVTGREYLEKIIQLPINIVDIDEATKQKYIEFSSNGKSLTVIKLLERITFLKKYSIFGEDLSDWGEKIESEKDPTTTFHSVVTYLSSQHKLKLSGNIPSVRELTKDKEKLDNFLLSVSKALNDVTVSGGNRAQPPESNSDGSVSLQGSDGESPVSGTGDSTSPEKPARNEKTIDMSEYNRIYSPILNRSQLNVFKQLSFIIPENPRSIKRILNVYSLVRIYRSYKEGIDLDTFDSLSKKMMKFIILLERWPYATSLMIEVIVRLNYERGDMYRELVLDEDRSNCDKKELCDRILRRARVNGDTDYFELKLYRLFDALEQELRRHNPGGLRSILSRDYDIRLFKKCLFHKDNEEVLMVHDINDLMPYAFNLNLMLLDCARDVIDEFMIPIPIPKQTQTDENDSEGQLPTDGEK